MAGNRGQGPSGHYGCHWTNFQQFIYGACTKDECMKNVDHPGVPCVRELLSVGLYKEVLKFLLDNQFRDSCYHPAVLSLATCMLYSPDQECVSESSKMVRRLCNIPTKLFLLIHSLQLAAHGNDYMKKNKKKKKKKNKKKKKKKQAAANSISETSEMVFSEDHVASSISQMHLTPASGSSHSEEGEPSKTHSRKRKHKPSVSDERRPNKRPKIPTRAWGRRRRRAISSFYLAKDSMTLLYQLTKYKRRHHWSHKRVLFLCHPKISNTDKQPRKLIFDYLKYGYKQCRKRNKKSFQLEGCSQDLNWCIRWINCLENIKSCCTVRELKDLLEQECQKVRRLATDDDFAVCWEHIPTKFLKNEEIFRHLLVNMPITAMIRNLRKMDTMGLLADEAVVHTIIDRLQVACPIGIDPSKCKVHPLKLLNAWIVNRDRPRDNQGNCNNQGNHGNQAKRGNPQRNPVKSLLMSKLKNTAFALLQRGVEQQQGAGMGRKFIVAIDLNLSSTKKDIHAKRTIHKMQFGLCLLASLNDVITGGGRSTGAGNCVVYYEFFQALKCTGELPSLEQMIKHCEKTDKLSLRDIFQEKSFEMKVCEDDKKCFSLPVEYALRCKEKADMFIILTESLASKSDRSLCQLFQSYRRDVNNAAKFVILDLHQYDGNCQNNIEDGAQDYVMDDGTQQQPHYGMELFPGVLHLPAHDPNVLAKIFSFINNDHDTLHCPYCRKVNA